MEIIINNSRTLKTEDQMSMAEFLRLAESLKSFNTETETISQNVKRCRYCTKILQNTSLDFCDECGKNVFGKKTVNTLAKSNEFQKSKIVTKKLKQYLTQNPQIKHNKAKHKWESREQATEALRIHYRGTAEEKQRFADMKNTPWYELIKGFSALKRRFKIKPADIGLKEFIRPRQESLATSPLRENKKKTTIYKPRVPTKDDETAKRIYEMRQAGMTFADIKKQVGLTNNRTRYLYSKYYQRVYMKNYQNKQKHSQTVTQPTANVPSVMEAEEEIVTFFKEINAHTPEQIGNSVKLLSQFLKTVKNRTGNAEDISDFLNEHFPNQLTPILNPDEIEIYLNN